jgi:ribosomal protein L37E
MPRDGSLTLSDIRTPTLEIACKRCGRYRRFNVKQLIAAHGGDAKLTDLLAALVNCRKARSFAVHDRCPARFERFEW